MPNLSRDIVAHVPPLLLWETVKDLVKNPLRYMPLATAATVVPGARGGFDSTIDVFGFKLHEHVTFNEVERSATYALLDNPDWSGTRKVVVGGGPKQNELKTTTRLEIDWDWTPL